MNEETPAPSSLGHTEESRGKEYNQEEEDDNLEVDLETSQVLRLPKWPVPMVRVFCGSGVLVRDKRCTGARRGASDGTAVNTGCDECTVRVGAEIPRGDRRRGRRTLPAPLDCSCVCPLLLYWWEDEYEYCLTVTNCWQ
eukprot:scaffold11069_cov36-Tisochrysis_lutea.AAC.3